MRYFTVIAACIVLNITYAQLVAAGAESPAAPATAIQDSTASDELHFVSVLTSQGEIVAIDPAQRLVTLKGPNGEILRLEVEREEDLAAREVGERVTIRYFEGGQIGKEKLGGEAPVQSLKNGMIEEPGRPSEKHHAVAASVERVDAGNQEITLKAPDGSLETIMVANPEYLRHIKAGDRIVITGVQALALSFEKAG
jgi:hypothetical protein